MATVPAPTTLYENVAGNVRTLILQHAFRPGDRLPSVRELSRQMSISVTTVLCAYRVLEDEGYVLARPQSGYYVRAFPKVRPSEPEHSKPVSVPSRFNRDDLLRDMQRHGGPNIVPLAFAVPNPDLLPHGRLARITASVAREHPEVICTYGPAMGERSLREQIAQRAFSSSTVVSPGDVVVTAGCQEALALALMAVTSPGGIVVVDSPCHYGVLQVIDVCGLRSLEVSTRARGGLCLDALEEAVRLHRVKGESIQACVVNTSFHNPLGGLMSDEDKRHLAEFALANDIVLIEDDVYGDLGFDNVRPRAAASWDPTGSAILCSSVSKTVAPGYRVGWAISRRHRPKIERIKVALSSGAALLPQKILAEFFASGGYDRYLRRARKTYESNIVAMSDAVSRSFPAGTRMTHPEGGIVLWIECPPAVDSYELYHRALERGVLIASGLLFSAGDSYRNCLRLTAAHWDETREAAVRVLGKLATQMARDRAR